MAAIKAEHDHQNKTIQEQKSALDKIIGDLGSLRLVGKDREASISLATTPRETPAPDSNNVEMEDVAERGGAQAVVEGEEREEGEADKPSESLTGTGPNGAREDIEMGEVEEDPKDSSNKSKRRSREELEEGEASDTSSALSDPPDE